MIQSDPGIFLISDAKLLSSVLCEAATDSSKVTVNGGWGGTHDNRGKTG